MNTHTFAMYFQLKKGFCISHDKQTKSNYRLLRPSFIIIFSPCIIT